MDKISGLMLCYNMDRLEQLERAVQCFAHQTCDNDKELIVVCNGTEEHFEKVYEILKNIGWDDEFRLAYRDKKTEHLSIGDLRNFAVEMSTGDVLVPWDDDDLNHDSRLETQYNYMVENEADVCFLSDHLHYFYNRNRLFWVNWGYDIPNTMMCRKHCFDNLKYPSLNHHEDSKIANRISNNFKSCTLEKKGYLFTYCYSYSSIFGFDHHMNNIAMGKDLSFMQDVMLKLESLYYIKGYGLDFLETAVYTDPHHPLYV